MDDQAFIEAFESCALPAGDFHHRDHVRLAWLYLQRGSILAAVARFSEGLKRLAQAQGKSGLYHETVTWAYIFLINERMERTGRSATWEEFAERNGDLLSWKVSILKQYYREETLKSELARRVFVLPDQVQRTSGR